MIFLLIFMFGITTSIGDENLLQKFVVANSKVTADLYRESAAEVTGNMIICPLSAQIVLSMLHAGAKGNTAKEIASALHFEDNTDEIQKMMNNVSPFLETNDPYLLTSANKMYVDHSVKLNKDYKETVTDVFRAEIENINFTNTDEAKTNINNWVENKTNNTIKDLVGDQDVNKDTVSFLVNAMFLDAKWEYQFKMNNTKKRKFYTNNDTNVEPMEIDTMKIHYHYNYYVDRKLDAEFLEMPLIGQDLKVVFALPKKIDGLKDLEARISDVLAEHPFQEEDVLVYLPKFQTETPLNLNSILNNLGIVEAYSPAANFSGISTYPLLMQNAVQKTYIALNERGTIVGTATGVSITDRFPPAFTFDANHPFMYYIKHRNVGIVFIGRVTAPENIKE